MNSAEKLGYLANLARCQAQDTIHQGNYDPADYRSVYRLFLTATGNEETARQAQARAAELYADQCVARARRR